MLYQTLNWPAGNYWNYDHHLMIANEPGSESYYFWSVQFGIAGTSHAGYMGLQSDCLDNDGKNIGKGFNVAIWGANEATTANGAKIRSNTDGESGRALFMPYSWKAGVSYRLRIWQTTSTANSTTWGFWIMDSSTNVDTHIGTITYPAGGANSYLSNSSVVWTEHYVHNTLQRVSAFFFNAAMNDNAVKPSSTSVRNGGIAGTKVFEPSNAVVQQVVATEPWPTQSKQSNQSKESAMEESKIDDSVKTMKKGWAYFAEISKELDDEKTDDKNVEIVSKDDKNSQKTTEATSATAADVTGQ